MERLNDYFRLLSIILAGLLLQTNLPAAEKKYQLLAKSQQTLTNVQQLMEQNKYQEAVPILNDLLKSTSHRKYDLAVTYQTLGYVHSGLNDHNKAVQAFTRAIQIGSLPGSIMHELRFAVAQLLIHKGDYKEGIKFLTQWFRQERNPPAQAHFMAATAYYNLKEYKQMVHQANNAISKRDNPPSLWYELLLAGYYETNNYIKAAELMEKMLKLFPDKDEYWMQLAGIYLTIKREKKALAMMELAYVKGLMSKNDELLQLARTYLYLEMPYKAANLIETEMDRKRIKQDKDSLILLADSWLLAQERKPGIKALAQAADTYKDSDLYYRLGQLYVDEEAWDRAIEALSKVTADSSYSNIADAYLLLGIAAFEGDEKVRSYKALSKALNYKHTKKQAQQWIAQFKKK